MSEVASEAPLETVQIEVRGKKYDVEIDREDDGQWIADVPAVPGIIVYGDTKEAAIANAAATLEDALKALEEQI